MGTPRPPDNRELIDGKYYIVWIEIYNSNFPNPPDCSAPYLGTSCCCLLGAAIKTKLERGDECKHFWGFCHTLEAQRIYSITGPYDNPAGCIDAGCPW